MEKARQVTKEADKQKEQERESHLRRLSVESEEQKK